MYIPGKLALKK